MYSFRRAIFCHTVHSSGEGVSFRSRSNIYKRGQRKRKKKIEEKKKKKKPGEGGAKEYTVLFVFVGGTRYMIRVFSASCEGLMLMMMMMLPA